MALQTVARCLGAGCLLVGGTLLTGWGLLADTTPGHTPFTAPRFGLRLRPAATVPPARETPAVRTGRTPVDPSGDTLRVAPARSLATASGDTLQALLPPLGEVDPQPHLFAGGPGPAPDPAVGTLNAQPQIPARHDAESELPANSPPTPTLRPSPAASPSSPQTNRGVASSDAVTSEPETSEPETNETATTESATSEPAGAGESLAGAARGAGVAGDSSSGAAAGESAVAGTPSAGPNLPPATAGRSTQMLSLRGQTSRTSVRGGRAKRDSVSQTAVPAAGESRGQHLALVANADAPSVGRGELTPPPPLEPDAGSAVDGVENRLQQPLATIPTRLQARRLPRVLPPGRGATTAEYASLFQRSAPLLQPALAVHLPPPRRYTYDFQHRPLYFEQPGLERCGRSFGCGTTVVSATAFLAQTALLPYQVLALGPCTPVSPLGDCPCGTLYPWCAALPAPCDSCDDTTECHLE